MPISKVKDMYYSSSPVHALNIKTLGTLDMYGMMNVLIDKGIISMPSSVATRG
jgi:hypothetical protein